MTYEHVLDCVGSAICVLFVGHWIRRRRDPLRGAPLRTNRLDLLTVLWVMLFYWLAVGVLEWLTRPGIKESDSAVQLRVAMLQPMAGLIGGVVCLLVGRHVFRAGLRGLGIGRRAVWRDVCFAVVTYVAVFPAIQGLYALSVVVFEWFRPGAEPPPHAVIEILHQPEHTVLLKTWLVFGAAVTAPFGEELFFRGYVQTLLKRYLRSRWGALVATGVLFGLIHWAQPQAVLPLALLGCGLGYAYERTGSLVCPMLLHAIFNGVTLAYQLSAGLRAS